MKQLKVRILENKRLTSDFHRMRVESSYLAKNTKPGQFIHVRCSDEGDPILRRPFSVHRILKRGIEILYEVVGMGTGILSRKKTGDFLDIIGPLGNGFKLNAIRYPLNAILIAGGIGIAPLLALAEELRSRKRKVYVIIGAKTKSHILCEPEFTPLGCDLKVATEDGSKGKKGLATDLLKEFLSAIRYPLNAMIYACGPNGMLKTVAHIAGERRILCQVSLEERMACGIGVCLGCPVKVRTNDERRMTNDEYKMVCKDGPVFNAEEIVW